eukprot:1038961-Prymnesium_polylepis.1
MTRVTEARKRLSAHNHIGAGVCFGIEQSVQGHPVTRREPSEPSTKKIALPVHFNKHRRGPADSRQPTPCKR